MNSFTTPAVICSPLSACPELRRGDTEGGTEDAVVGEAGIEDDFGDGEIRFPQQAGGGQADLGDELAWRGRGILIAWELFIVSNPPKMINGFSRVVLGAVLIGHSTAFAAPGDVDFTFGTAGKVTTDFVDSGDVGNAVKVLGNGKVLVAGRTNIGGINHFGVVRYHHDGTLDTSFGIAGKVTLLIGTECEASSIDVQESDGKILVAGTAKLSNKWQFAVARFTTDGDLDTDFSVDGIVTATPVTRYTSHNYCRAIVVQPDGKIVLGGSATTHQYGSILHSIHSCAVRLLGDGSLDPAFGSNGAATESFQRLTAGVSSMLVDSDGRVVLGGYSGTGGSSSPNFAIYRYLSNGTLDSEFGTNGKVVIDFFGQQDSIASLTEQPDGRILAVGSTWTGSEYRVAVLRLHPNGTVDSGFGTDGKVTVPHPDGNFSATDVVVQPDGRILISGSVAPTSGNRKMTVARLHHNGAVDAEFGTNGVTTVAVPGSTDDAATSIAIQAYNGPTFSYRVLVAGRSIINNQADFCVVGFERGALGEPPPAVGVPSLVGVTAGGATFAVSVNPNGSHTSVTLEYGPLGESPSQIPLTLFPSDGSQYQLVEHRLTQLVPDTDYVVRLVAESEVGTVASANESFHTLKRPVVFVPGIAGSVLKYRLGGTGAWAGLWPSVDPIAISLLNPNGGVSNAQAIDVVRTFLVDFYGNFIDKWTDDLGYTEYQLEEDPERLTSDHMLDRSLDERPTFFVFPYDWRLANQVHGATLHTYLGNISQLHDGVKPNLLAHSMGGLLVRSYVLDYGAGYVSKIVTVGSPLWGAPRTLYTMFSGAFFPIEAFDVFNTGAMRRLAANSPGAHQLLPSDLLEGHKNDFNPPEAFPPFVIEQRIDFNRNSTIDDGRNSAHSYSLAQVLDKIDGWTKRWRIGSGLRSPSVESVLFHSEHGGQQGDWSSDLSGVGFLHIAGQLESNDTTSAVVVEPLVGRGGTLGNQTPRFREIREEALGDGTVPLVSAIRRPEYLAPNSQVRVVIGPKSSLFHPERKASHNALMQNATVTQMITAFFAGDPVPYQEAPPPPANVELSIDFETVFASHQEIFILGAGYVTMTDGDGNTNALLSEIAAQQVPGVEADYGGEDLWCRLEVEPEVALTLSGASPSDVVEILVSQIGSDGSTLSMRRFLIEPAAMQWRFTLPAVDMANPTEPEMLVDTNGDEDFTPDEQVTPTHSADGPNVDVTPPQLTLSLSASGPGIVSTLSPQDNAAGVKAFYTFNGGPVTEYSVPLDFAEGTEGILRAFAEDAMGNRSGLITTTVRPSVQVRNSGASSITLDWPVAEGYVLEEADNPGGPWRRSDADISQETFTESAEIGVSPNSQKFYRLKAQPVAR